MSRPTKKKRKFPMWIVTVDGHPVAGTAAYTRKLAVSHFIGNEDPSIWEKEFKPAGYAVVKAIVVLTEITGFTK